MTDGRDHDAALVRLEDVLAGLPFDRALPGLGKLLADAGVDEAFLAADDRARKVLHEAIVARPLSSVPVVERYATEVELLTLEVEVLAERIGAADDDSDDRNTAVARLAAVRARLEQIKRLL